MTYNSQDAYSLNKIIMSQKSITLIVILLFLIVAGMFIYANLKKAELQNTLLEAGVQDDKTETSPYADITQIDAKHYFVDGKHTLVGEINMPTPCDLLEADASVLESFPEQIKVAFLVINNSESCVETITPQRFKVEVIASEQATFSATFMGREVSLNLVPAAPGEVPEEFELFIKG